MKKLLIGISIIVIGIIPILLFINTRKKDTEDYNFLETMEYLPSQKVEKSNENKIIIIFGKLQVESNAKDEDFNINIDSPIIRRNVEYYKENNGTYKWELQKEITDKYKYKTEEFYGELSLGEFKIDPSKLIDLLTLDYYSDYSRAEILNSNFELEEHKNGPSYLTKALNIKDGSKDSQYKDSMRIYYEYIDKNRIGTKTIVGVQKDGLLTSTNEFEMHIYEGVKNKTEIINDLYKPHTLLNFIYIIIFIICEIIGILTIKKWIKERKK